MYSSRVCKTDLCSSLNFELFDMITKVDTKTEIGRSTFVSFGSYLTEWWLAYTIIVLHAISGHLYKQEQTMKIKST